MKQDEHDVLVAVAENLKDELEAFLSTPRPSLARAKMLVKVVEVSAERLNAVGVT